MCLGSATISCSWDVSFVASCLLLRLDVPWLCPCCSLDVSWLIIRCVLVVHWMCLGCLLDALGLSETEKVTAELVRLQSSTRMAMTRRGWFLHGRRILRDPSTFGLGPLEMDTFGLAGIWSILRDHGFHRYQMESGIRIQLQQASVAQTWHPITNQKETAADWVRSVVLFRRTFLVTC